MSTLSIFNPANCQLVNTLPADDADSFAAKATAARPTSRLGRYTASHRKSCVEKFRASVVQDMDALALTMTRETGKPVQLSRNELNGLLGRIDFFLAQVDGCLATITVMSEGGMTEQIEHIALGVFANISAWNYPWFVGCNVILPALLAGNAVFYKPSECATNTGLAIARLLHQAGVPQDVMVCLSTQPRIGYSRP